jgi:hypothetical protein
VVKSSRQLPPIVTNDLLTALNAFFESVDKHDIPAVHHSPAPDQDSQDYGDVTFLEEFVAAEETSSAFPIGVVISNISTYLYQIIGNLFGIPKLASGNLASIIDTWILAASILVKHRQRDWPTFLQYGGEWERLRSTNSKASRTWCPYILTKILSVDPNAYFQGQDHFISAWFESIIEPDMTRQHSFTALLLNIDDENTILANPLFTRNTSGVYEITSDALFEARPVLIVRMFRYFIKVNCRRTSKYRETFRDSSS